MRQRMRMAHCRGRTPFRPGSTSRLPGTISHAPAYSAFDGNIVVQLAENSKKKISPGAKPEKITACQKSLAEFAAASGKESSIIFGRGVYVDENTSRPANVRGVSRKPRALRQGASLIGEKRRFFDKLKSPRAQSPGRSQWQSNA